MNSNEIRTYASGLLQTFGEEVDPNSPYTNTPTLPTYLSHSAYGLKISDYKGIKIDFDNSTVYDTDNGIYKPGIWEEILKEYYYKIPKILKDRENAKILKNKCDTISKRLSNVLYLGYQEKRKEEPALFSRDYHEYTFYDFGNNFRMVYDFFYKDSLPIKTYWKS